ncbi:MAG: type II toxin-antitoxin system death-on-curing family toxin [Gemmatimonadaceae bacterium]|nr:type II toxin-antitoxin system death-on-curing family toxin [Gemmatimonadaceae bacterium]
MREPRWVPRLVVDSVHVDQLREHGGLLGVRDENALEAALAGPRQKWNYEPESDLSVLAAAYAFGVAKAHPFNDGNKRTAFLTMVIFLGLNGKDLKANESEVVQVMVALAAGSLKESGLAIWIRKRKKRLTL